MTLFSRFGSLVFIGLVGSAGLGAERVQRPFEVSPRHAPQMVMGREYWTYLNYTPLTDPVTWSRYDPTVWSRPWYNPVLTNYAVFTECGIVSSAWQNAPIQGSEAALKTVRDHFTPDDWAGIESKAASDRPLVVDLRAKTSDAALAGNVNIDHEDWRQFKKDHPNLVCTRSSVEWGNNLWCAISRTVRNKTLDRVRHAELMANWAKYDLSNRYDRVKLQKWYFDRLKKLNYDDSDTFLGFRSFLYLDHMAAAWGAKYLVSETTNTTGEDDEYRWDISGMFVRGAARQFSLPWCWYVAIFFNGRKENGEMMYDSFPSFTSRQPFPQGGVSPSLQRRAWYYAYLNGANAVEPEGWHEYFFTTNTPSGKAALSDRGHNFVKFHEFTKLHPDRGITYAPVAVLVPFAQGYPANGDRCWMICPLTEGDYALNALFFTIAPGWNRNQGLRVGRGEGNLHNSRFAMMYDVLVPDSPQPKEAFRKALFAYPAAVLVGDYEKPGVFVDVLDDYVKAGGELVRITPDMLPHMGKNPILEMRKGLRKFGRIEQCLASLQNRLFPFEVNGDVLFGANRTPKGWWLWVFNNKGVVKFADAFERIDHACDSQVEVDLRKVKARKVVELMSGRELPVAGTRFADLVPAGDFHVFEITE